MESNDLGDLLLMNLDDDLFVASENETEESDR